VNFVTIILDVIMYSLDLRKVACRLYEKYGSSRKVSMILEVSHSSVCRWVKTIARKRYFRQPKLCSGLVKDTIRTTLLVNPFVSIRTLVTKIKEICQVAVSRELVRVAIAKLQYTKKKAKAFSCPKNLEQKTMEFKTLRDTYIQQERPFFSLDETSFGRHSKVQKGYALKGQLLKIIKPKASIQTVSSLVVISNKKIMKHEEIKGSYNKTTFLNFLSNLQLPHKSVILLDNVSFHHCCDVKELAKEKQWELLYVPPYSPWFNPIEGVFSIVKRRYYCCYDIQSSFDAVTEDHCASFFKKSLEL
jgi:transposase